MPRKQEEQPLKIHGTMDDTLRTLLQVPVVKREKAKGAKRKTTGKKRK